MWRGHCYIFAVYFQISSADDDLDYWSQQQQQQRDRINNFDEDHYSTASAIILPPENTEATASSNQKNFERIIRKDEVSKQDNKQLSKGGNWAKTCNWNDEPFFL